MLVVFFILFTKILADSEEDTYVDLLPDEEKQQFLEKVARRILKDVESQENVADAQSGELSDEQLKQHTEYVKTVLKEEQENVRRSKGDNVKDKKGKPASDEEVALSVKPLATEKVSLPDLTLREERRGTPLDENNKNKITIEMGTDNVPIIKRSVQDDNASKSYESDETTSETLHRVTKPNVTSEESNEEETTSTKVKNGNVATKAKVLSGKDESESVDTNQSVSSESGTYIESVKGFNEPLSRRSIRNNTILAENITVMYSNDTILAENITDSNTTTTIVADVKSAENKSDEHYNVSSSDEETLTYPLESSSIKDTATESTTPDSPLSITTLMSNKGKDSEPLQKYTNHTSKDTENEVETTTKSTLTSTFTDEETTESVPETTKFVAETTELVPKTTTDDEIMTTEAVTESTTVLLTTENTTKSIPVVTTKDTRILVEDFTSIPTITTIVQSTTFKPQKTIKKKPVFIYHALSEELTTAALGSDEESIEATTTKKYNHKAHKYIAGPEAKQIAEADKDVIQNKNFIELEKKYYDNNFNVKVGKQYHVYEIPVDASPFIKYDEPIADQPYYVPIYNYSPHNAYFNPKNRLGPNAGDSSAENNDVFNDDDDDINQLDKTERFNFKMEYDRTIDSKRKKFDSKLKLSNNIHKQPLITNEHLPRGKIKPEDYLDSDYYFKRVRKELARRVNKEDFAKFPNSDETDHPARSIQEGSLKDHVRAVRNILFHQKSFGLLEKDKYGKNVVNELRTGRMNSEAKQGLRKGQDDEDIEKTNDSEYENDDENKNNNIAIDYYFGRVKPEKPSIVTSINQNGSNNIHIQKVGYLKSKSDTKELYVMDDFFKANVEKYIKENDFTPSPQLPYQATTASIINQRDEVIAYLRQEERRNKAENNNVTSMIKREVSIKATQYQADNPVNPNKNNNTEKILDVKLNLRRNDVIKVSVYLQVLNDMVTLDNKALIQYDWLGTTVDIQAALQKLFQLTALVSKEEDVHPADMEILKYVLFLHKLATEIIEANDVGAQLRKKLALSRNKKKLKPHLMKDKRLINMVWLYLRKEVPQVNEYEALKHLNTFLMGVEDGLYDLHDAVKNVAKITKYRNQHWYQNLKDLYINTDEKHLLELLLHMTSLRLFSLVEESAKNGLEEDYVKYMKQNRKHSKRTLEEMMFVMEILEEYNKFVE